MFSDPDMHQLKIGSDTVRLRLCGWGRSRQEGYCHYFVLFGFTNMTIMSYLLVEFSCSYMLFQVAFPFPPTDLLSFVF